MSVKEMEGLRLNGPPRVEQELARRQRLDELTQASIERPRQDETEGAAPVLMLTKENYSSLEVRIRQPRMRDQDYARARADVIQLHSNAISII
jgi:hypothetical protein